MALRSRFAGEADNDSGVGSTGTTSYFPTPVDRMVETVKEAETHMSEVEEAHTAAAPASGTLTYNGTTLDLKVVPATEGASGVEIGKLLSTTGVVTLDPGYTNTGSTTSAITYID